MQSDDANPAGSSGMVHLLRLMASAGTEAQAEIESWLSDEGALALESDRALMFQSATSPGEIEAAASVIPVTVMFADVRNFTTLVEEYPPNQVVRQLNEYFSVMTRIIVMHEGVLDKYMGDEIMTYFECKNPMDYPRAAKNAVSAGIAMLDALEKLNRRWKNRGWPTLKIGIGINSGPVLQGNIGSLIKMDTTIIGDTVNLASRLQQLNKEFNASLLISESTQKLVAGEFEVHSKGEVSIRGRKQSAVIYEVDVAHHLAPPAIISEELPPEAQRKLG